MGLQVLNSVSKPPGSAPPFIPFKPVPKLVPLPSRHTLPVQQPNRFKLSNFGHLREENLQMVLLARRITQQLVDIRCCMCSVLDTMLEDEVISHTCWPSGAVLDPGLSNGIVGDIHTSRRMCVSLHG